LYTAITTPFLALIPSAVSPFETAFKAYSIYKSFPFEEKVVKEKSPIENILIKLLKIINFYYYHYLKRLTILS
jgi:hypothetical protein